MFHGPIAAAGLLDPPAAPTGTATLDFLAGTYTVNGVGVAVADIIANPDRVGASGLEIPDFTSGMETSITGDLLALIVIANWTAVFEYEQMSGAHNTELLWVSDESAVNQLSVDRKFPSGGGYIYVFDEDSTFVSREADDAQEVLSGVHKVAVTVTNARLAISVDGADATVDTGASDKTMDRASFGGPVGTNSYTGFYLRALSLQAPVDDADLPSLSA